MRKYLLSSYDETKCIVKKPVSRYYLWKSKIKCPREKLQGNSLLYFELLYAVRIQACNVHPKGVRFANKFCKSQIRKFADTLSKCKNLWRSHPFCDLRIRVSLPYTICRKYIIFYLQTLKVRMLLGLVKNWQIMSITRLQRDLSRNYSCTVPS